MADVFISYHRSDGASALVRRIAGELESRGISCWYDTKNTAPVDFVELIVTEIDCCKVFLFLWDEKANKNSKERNSYVRREIHRAYKKNVALVPFRVGDFEKNPTLEFYFDPINILYGGDSPETAQIGELVNAITDALDKPQSPPKIVKRGNCGTRGDNVTYTLTESGVLTISGYGGICDYFPMAHVDLMNPPWWNERKSISHVKIQNGITSIGTWAFGNCDGLLNASIPDSVTSIQMFSFYACTGLTSINIPDSVTFIGDFAFANCQNLTRISLSAKAEVEKHTFPDTVRVTRRE